MALTHPGTKPLFVTALLASVLGTAVLGCSEESPTPGDGAGGSSAGVGGSVAGMGQAGAQVVAGMGQGGSVAGMGQGGASAGMAGSGTAGSSAGSGQAGAAAGSGGSSTVGLPASDSKDDIIAFLKAGTYKTAPWVKAQEVEPKNHTKNPMEVWLSGALVTSLRDNRPGAVGARAADVGSMAVKEFKDEAGAVVGHAALYRGKAADAATSWTFFCYGPTGRCPGKTTDLTIDQAVHMHGDPSFQCSACHSTLSSPAAQIILSKAP
jgi:hypothetical protein